MIPFTIEQFLAVFAQYNQAVWPMQIVLMIAAVTAVLLALRPEAIASRMVSLLLAGLWLWTGDVYHALFFSRINRAAFVFGALFLIQAVLFFYLGVIRQKLKFRMQWNAYSLMGGLMMLYALLLYPLLGQLLGHVYPTAPTFGAPCPLTIFTFGLLLWLEGEVKWFLLVIPVFWSLLGLSAVVSLGMREDFALPLAGFVAVVMLVRRNRKRTSPAPENWGGKAIWHS